MSLPILFPLKYLVWLNFSGGFEEPWAEISYIKANLFYICCEECVSQIIGKYFLWSLYLRMLGRILLPKTATVLVFFLSKKKSLRNGHILDLLITSRNVVFFLISSMVLCLLFQLKRFRKLQLTELLEFIIDLELLEL